MADVALWTAVASNPPSLVDDITAWATLALAAVTVALAYIATRQMKLTRDAVKVAEQDTREATWARIDEAAPRVTFLARAPEEHQAAWLIPLEPGTDFDLSRFPAAEVAVGGLVRSSQRGEVNRRDRSTRRRSSGRIDTATPQSQQAG